MIPVSHTSICISQSPLEDLQQTGHDPTGDLMALRGKMLLPRVGFTTKL